MTVRSPASAATSKPGGRSADIVTYAAIALAVWLGWEVVKAPIVQRAPPELAVRLASGSAEVLSRAAEAELAAERPDNAAFVARASLARAPFNPEALRVLGLAVAEAQPDDADQIMTLAGNLSLRDGETHAWLVQQRLERGDYGSSFAHADTLVRRRNQLAGPVFDLYTTAAVSDPRALSALRRLLSTRPRWRQDYLEYLYEEADRAALLATLVISLESTPGRLSDPELRQFYDVWRRQKRIAGVRLVRETLGRPPLRPMIQNGDFEQAEAEQILPFGWTMGMGPGIAAAVTESGDLSHGRAAWIEYDGFSSGLLLEQLMILPPGRSTISGEWRIDGRSGGAPVAWQVVCVGSEQTLVSTSAPIADEWRRFSFETVVPISSCEVQALRLVGAPADFRRMNSIWIDNVTAVPAAS